MAKRLQVAALLSFPRACTGLFLSERTSTGVSQFCRVVHTAPKTVTLSTLGERLALSDSSRDKEASSTISFMAQCAVAMQNMVSTLLRSNFDYASETVTTIPRR